MCAFLSVVIRTKLQTHAILLHLLFGITSVDVQTIELSTVSFCSTGVIF